jgi:hypothetical protein
LESQFGKLNVGFEQVAALVGEKSSVGESRLFLRDGQVLSGKLQCDGLRFKMNTGLELALTSDKLDRIVLGTRPEDGMPSAGAVAMIEMVSGVRLALKGGQQQKIAATTPWGERQPAIDDLLRLTAAEDLHGHFGSRLFCFLSNEPLTLNTLAFGPVSFQPSEIRSITAAASSKDSEKEATEILGPHFLLAGGNILAARIDLPVVNFRSAGQLVPVPPEQIKLLKNMREEESSSDSDDATVFEAELWDGSTIRGTLVEQVLPARAPDRVSKVRTKDVMEVRVTAPTVPDTLRVKIAAMIRDLGHPEYVTRENATRSLRELGDVTRLQLKEKFGQGADPETRRRVEALLGELGE